jgi:hypothetical protein
VEPSGSFTSSFSAVAIGLIVVADATATCVPGCGFMRETDLAEPPFRSGGPVAGGPGYWG